MGKQYTLAELVELADEKGTLDDVSDLIIRLYAQDDEEALDLMIKLAFFDYGGGTHKAEFQKLGVVGCLHWGGMELKNYPLQQLQMMAIGR